MRILILANNDIGLYQFRKELIQELLKEKEVYIALPYGERVEDLKHMGCHFIDAPLERRGVNPFSDFKLYRLYKSIIKRVSPDMVITYTIKPNIYGGYACKKMRIPYATNITGLGTAFQKKGLLKTMVVAMYKIALKKAKVVFFENVENKKIFVEERIIDDEKTKVLSGAGVNTEQFTVLEYPKTECIHFLFIARVMAEKGIEELLEAMERLISSGINCHLDVLGWCEEAYEERLKSCEEKGWLSYYGFQKDVRPFIKEAHCFVLPSWHDGMANTNLECAACGRPVITTRIHGCMESVEENVSGFLVEKKNTESLYEAMKKFTELSYDEKRNMGLAGRKRMEKIFEKKIVVKDTLEGLN